MEACDKVLEQIFSEMGSIDILINNAGRSIRRSINLSYDRFHDYERVMQLNYFGSLSMIMGVLPLMEKKRSGHIINISSIGVLSNAPRFSAYVASKAALDAFSRCAAAEFSDTGIQFHHHQHAAGPDADDRADQDLRKCSDDHARRSRCHGQASHYLSNPSVSQPGWGFLPQCCTL